MALATSLLSGPAMKRLLYRKRKEDVVALLRHGAFVPDLAARHRLPQAYSDIEIAKAGGLVYIGASFPAMHRKAARLVDAERARVPRYVAEDRRADGTVVRP